MVLVDLFSKYYKTMESMGQLIKEIRLFRIGLPTKPLALSQLLFLVQEVIWAEKFLTLKKRSLLKKYFLRMILSID